MPPPTSPTSPPLTISSSSPQSSPAWTISSSSSTDSSPRTPAPRSARRVIRTAFTSPPLSPMGRLHRQSALTTAPKRGWVTAPRTRQTREPTTAVYLLDTLPEVQCLHVTGVQADKEDDLCDQLNRILDFSDQESEKPPLKGATRWLEAGSFERGREKSAKRLLEFFDRHVLSGMLLHNRSEDAPVVSVTWSNRLYKTAGMTYMKRRAGSGERTALIQLSTKVVDEPDRLYNTLAHEMCHAATWIIDDSAKPPHGAVFKKWARKFSRWDPSLKITTCHDYDIRYKFNYECVSCGQGYGRHSRSINTNKQVCGRCRGALTLLKS